MKGLFLSVSMILFCALFANAQTAGSIGGTVVDSNGAVVPNATITVKGESGQEFNTTTAANGTYRIPAVSNGFYIVTITATGFKKTIVEQVKVDVATPATVDAILEVGSIEQTVEVTGGGEVLQTQTATVGTNIQGRQITETPQASRDALDLVTLMPGTASVGRPRATSINGLPKGSMTITIDGVDVQDNVLRSSDGYFTYVRPRVDAIEEVTVSTANPGAESGGDGAVQIRFVTARGTNNYRGGLYWQHRNTALNAAYWFNNRDLKPLPGDDKAPRNRIILNQFGGKFGGPIPFLNFGEGGPFWNSGKDRAFFFVNYEQFRLPESLIRTRTILTPDAQAGNFSYIVGSQTRSVNLYNIAAAAGQTSTADPTIASMLSQIRSAVGTSGATTPITNSSGVITDPNRLIYSFTPSSMALRKFLTTRFDFNLHKNHSLEFVMNRQKFLPVGKDFLNGVEERFPGFVSYSQGSNRNSYSTALRSTFGKNIVNEARYAVSIGDSAFFPTASPSDFSYSRGFLLDISAAGITTPYPLNSKSGRDTPTFDFTDSVNWILGNHNINFGGQYKLIKSEGTAINRLVPTISFGLLSDDTAAYSMFNTTSMPDASPAQIDEARSLYATLVGRVTGYSSNAYLTADGTYQENAEQYRLAKQNTYGLFIQDGWRINPSLTVNFGLRWQPQTSFRVLTGNYARVSEFADVYGVSGLGNIFKPGTLTGKVPTVVAMEVGEKAYPDDWNNFAPTLGVVWSPDYKDGLLRGVFGSAGKSVFRGGFSVSYVREGFNLLSAIVGANPGGSLSASRSATTANPFVIGTNLRTPNNPNLTTPNFLNSPAYPLTLTTSDSTNAFSPDLRTGQVYSYSLGYQREINKDTVVEIRYVGNKGVNLQRQYNINEFNTIENGFADEFVKAQANLYANIAAGRGNSFAYFGPGTNTSPLPIMLAYFNSSANYNPNDKSKYAAANFTNSTLVSALSVNSPNIFAFNGTSFENSAARRANASANGLPVNFFYVNPTTGVNGSFLVDNSLNTWYDSAVIEVRRRLSDGLRFQANYVFSKALSNAYASSASVFALFSQREDGLKLAKGPQAFDIRHQFKFDATYDLPFGKGRSFFSNANWFTEGILGGWTIMPSIKWQSGSPFSFGNVQLVGMTVKELQKSIGVYKGDKVVTFLPDDIILNSQKAFNISVANTTTNSGYGTTYGTGGPTGRFIAPAGYGNCIQKYAGTCGFNNLVVYGPSFFKFDMSVAKRIKFGERRNIELRATALDVLNAPNWRVGGWSADTVTLANPGSTFGQLGSGSAYQDLSTTNDPGGRLIDLMLRINF